jgi:hypothetical protein
MEYFNVEDNRQLNGVVQLAKSRRAEFLVERSAFSVLRK